MSAPALEEMIAGPSAGEHDSPAPSRTSDVEESSHETWWNAVSAIEHVLRVRKCPRTTIVAAVMVGGDRKEEWVLAWDPTLREERQVRRGHNPSAGIRGLESVVGAIVAVSGIGEDLALREVDERTTQLVFVVDPVVRLALLRALPSLLKRAAVRLRETMSATRTLADQTRQIIEGASKDGWPVVIGGG